MTRLIVVLLLAGAPDYGQSSARLEFEAAAVHPAPPPGEPFRVICEGGPGTRDPGLFTCQNMSLANLVTVAYRIDFNRLVAPEWMASSSERFSLSATAPPNTTREQFDLMFQNLLTDRFRLSVHHETRETRQFSLVVARGGPKFKESPRVPAVEAAVDARTNAPQRPVADANGFPSFQPGRSGMATYKGKARIYQTRMTMEMLTAQLAGQLHSPVADSTGLTGKYEIDLYWVMDSRLRTTALTDTATSAVETEAGPTLTQALQDELGLRLESKEGQADFLVVDHAEKIPLEN